MLRSAVLPIAFWVLTAAGSPAGQSGRTAPAESTLPDSSTFLSAVRENLADSQRRQNRYAYKERRTELRLNPFGRMGTGEVRVYDVVPNAEGTQITRRLIERDGEPVQNGEVQTRDLTERRGRSQSRSGYADVVDTLQFAVAGRELHEGRPMIRVSFSARPDARPQTREGRMARAFSGTIWVDEDAMEVARVEATAVDSISMGFGLVARLSEGTEASLTRRPVADGIWLPTAIRFTGEGRAMLFIRKVTVDYAIDWFDYRLVPGESR